MPAPHSANQADSEALVWARDQLNVIQAETVQIRSDYQIINLQTQSDVVHLVVAPSLHQGRLSALAALADKFPDSVPRLIAGNPALHAALIARPDGNPVKPDKGPAFCRFLDQYAALQADLCTAPDLLANFQNFDSENVVARFITMFSASERADGTLLFSRSAMRRYFDAFSLHADVLNELISRSSALPITLTHTDWTLDVLYGHAETGVMATNWFQAVQGPAGLPLNCFEDGCTALIKMLDAKDAIVGNAAAEINNAPLARYASSLVQCGYASWIDLQAGLQGAICAGAIDAVCRDLTKPPPKSSSSTRHRRYVEQRLSDLLDLCDHQALQKRDIVFASARSYQNNGRERRARNLLRQYTKYHPEDWQAYFAKADLLLGDGRREAAVEACLTALSHAPEKGEIHAKLGDIYGQNLQLSEARQAYRDAGTHGFDAGLLDGKLHRINTLAQLRRAAKNPENLPTITVSPEEKEQKQWHADTLALAVEFFRTYGVLGLHNVFDSSLLQGCYDQFIQAYQGYFASKAQADALQIGDKRFQIPLTLEGVFNDTGLYANPFILALMARLLSKKFILGCTVCATSMPGAKDQHWHKDHRALFTEDADDPPLPLPPFAITTMIPFVALDNEIGTTAVKKGSHLLSRKQSVELPAQYPQLPLGSCFLMDMRLSHAGMANQTDRIRPILNMVYQQHWFSDNKNYTLHPPLRVPKKEYKRIPEKYRKLLEWGVNPGPQINC